jgi:alpha-N-arabinofuranosidase
MGEYAAQSVGVVSPKNRNTLECALAEAAYMTGLERNAAVVRMVSYAPLFGNVEAWQWTPNLIWVDNHRIYGTPNYYAQQLFSRNRGDVVLPLSNDEPAAAHFFASAVRDNQSKDIILKVVNADSQAAPAAIHLAGIPSGAQRAQATILTSGNTADENSFDQPRKVAPVTVSIGKVKARFHYTFKPNSLTVLKIGPGNE